MLLAKLCPFLYLQPIFQDQNGLAVKFFLQKDLSQETQAEICEIITVRDLLGIFTCP
jgi:hypothetical protein